eukprot:887812_1
MSSSMEHQKCLQFLRSRNFLSHTPLGERQMILQKIRNALTQRYQHEELHRRTQILKECATYILQQQSNTKHITHNSTNASTNNGLVFDDLMSAPIATNTNTNTTTNDDDFTEFASAPPPPNTANDSFNAFDDTTFDEFSAAGPPLEPSDDTFDAFDAPQSTQNNGNAPPPTFDLLGGLSATQEAPKAVVKKEEEEDFMEFISTIKPKPTIDEYMKAAFDDKLHSINQRGQEKLSAMNISPKPTITPQQPLFGVVNPQKKKAVPSAKAIPDALNQLILEKLNEEDFGEGFDDFEEAQEIVQEEEDVIRVDDVEKETETITNIMDQMEETIEETKTNDAFDIPMDEFLNAAHDATAEYEDKMKIREQELNKKKKIIPLDDGNTFNPFADGTDDVDLNGTSHVKIDDDPFLALFGAKPKEVKKTEVVMNVQQDDDDDDDWGDFDAQNETIHNAEAFEFEVDKDVEINDFFDAQFETEIENETKEKLSKKEKKKRKKKNKKKAKKDKEIETKKKEMERQKEIERQKQIETEKEKEQQKEEKKQKEIEKEKERQKQKEIEMQKQKEETEKEKQLEKEKRRKERKRKKKEKKERKMKEKEEEMKRQKEEEMKRQKEEEMKR